MSNIVELLLEADRRKLIKDMKVYIRIIDDQTLLSKKKFADRYSLILKGAIDSGKVITYEDILENDFQESYKNEYNKTILDNEITHLDFVEYDSIFNGSGRSYIVTPTEKMSEDYHAFFGRHIILPLERLLNKDFDEYNQSKYYIKSYVEFAKEDVIDKYCVTIPSKILLNKNQIRYF